MKAAWTKMRPKVLARIKPTDAFTRRAHKAVAGLEKRLTSYAKTHKIEMKPRLVGSLAKDTHTIPKPDIDLFLLFDVATPREDLERDGLRLGRAVLAKPLLKYAEHPYVHGTYQSFSFDVVPAYRITDGAAKLSAVDRSPLHTDYVRKRLKPSQRDEVRILKLFLKGIGCYGAETATSGFSGYLAELLILRFGSFWDTLMGLRELHPPIQLALDGDAPPMGGDLVFVDPVDATRNAAAAVSRQRLETFMRAAKMFTATPRLEFFWPRPVKAEPEEALLRHLSHRGIFGLEVPAPGVRPDARVPHLRRFSEKINRALEGEGFQVVRNLVEPVGARYLLLWEHDPVVLPETYEHRGPSTEDADHSRRFLQKWQAHPDAVNLPHPKDGHWAVTLRRVQREPVAILAPRLPELLKGTDVSKRSRRPPSLKFGAELAQMKGTRLALTKLLVPRDPWDQ